MEAEGKEEDLHWSIEKEDFRNGVKETKERVVSNGESNTGICQCFLCQQSYGL